MVFIISLETFFTKHTGYGAEKLIYFSISEPAPVRLASLRAERAMVHWNGALAKLEEARGDRGVQDYLGTDGNKIKTRSRFTNENFYI